MLEEWLGAILPSALLQICREYAQFFDFTGNHHAKYNQSAFVLFENLSGKFNVLPCKSSFTTWRACLVAVNKRLKSGSWIGLAGEKIDLNSGLARVHSTKFFRQKHTWYENQGSCLEIGLLDTCQSFVFQTREGLELFWIRDNKVRRKSILPDVRSIPRFFGDELLYAVNEEGKTSIFLYNPLSDTKRKVTTLQHSPFVLNPRVSHHWEFSFCVMMSAWMGFSDHSVLYWQDRFQWCLPCPHAFLRGVRNVVQTADGKWLCQTEQEGLWVLQKVQERLECYAWKPDNKEVVQLYNGDVLCLGKKRATIHSLKSW